MHCWPLNVQLFSAVGAQRDYDTHLELNLILISEQFMTGRREQRWRQSQI